MYKEYNLGLTTKTTLLMCSVVMGFCLQGLRAWFLGLRLWSLQFSSLDFEYRALEFIVYEGFGLGFQVLRFRVRAIGIVLLRLGVGFGGLAFLV